MAGRENPIMLTPEATKVLRESSALVENLEYEVGRMKEAMHPDYEATRKVLNELKERRERLLVVYGSS